MTQNKTLRALFSSVLALLLCVSMFVGSTFAWFTDSVASGVNTIASGNLDIALYKGSVSNGAITYTDEVNASTKLFDDTAIWEPGYTEVAYLKVENKGSLALKYQLTVNVINEVIGYNSDGGEIKLSEVLKYDLVEIDPAEYFSDRTAAIGAVENAQNLATEVVTGNMTSGATKYFALIVYMPTTTGNEANYRGAIIPSIQLGVSIVATQDTVEDDSFDKLYDEKALYPLVASGNVVSGKDTVIKTENAEATVPFEATAEGAVYHELSIIEKENTESSVTISGSGISYDVEITNIAEGNTAVIPVSWFIGTDAVITDLYHGGQLMDNGTNKTIGEEDTYSYNAENGMLTIYVTHFSEFTLDIANETKVGTAYTTLAEAIELGGKIILLNDATAALTVKNGNTVIIELNGNKISNGELNANTVTVENGGALMLVGEGTVTNNFVNNAVLKVNNGGELVVDNIVIGREMNGNGSWYSIENEGKTTIKNATVNVPESDLAGTNASMIVNRGSGDLTIDDGYYYTDGCNCIKIEGGTVTVNGGTFTTGGYACVQNYGIFNATGGEFIHIDKRFGATRDINAVIICESGSTTSISDGIYSNEIEKFSSYDYLIYNRTSKITISGGEFTGNGKTFNSGYLPVVTGGKFVFASSTGMGNFSAMANHTVYDYNEGDVLLTRAYYSDAPSYDAEIVVKSDDGVFTYYKDASVCAQYSVYDGSSYYVYKNDVETFKIAYNSNVSVYYMNNTVEELNLVCTSEGYEIIKNTIDIGDSGAVKAYSVSCNGSEDSTVAKIGDKNYVTMRNVLYNVKSGDTIVLVKDCVYDSAAYDYDEFTFTLDLNGHQLTLGEQISMSAGGVLTVVDSGTNGSIVGKDMLSAGKGTLIIKDGSISCPLNSNTTSGKIEIDTDNVILVGTPVCAGIYNFDATSYIGRGYACTDNGNGTWKVAMATGYSSLTSGYKMKNGYIEVNDGGTYRAVKIDTAEDLIPWEGKVTNASLVGIDPTAYMVDGAVVQYTKSTNLFTGKETTSTLYTGTYTTPVVDSLRKNYMTYVNGDYFTITSITQNKITNTYFGKIAGGTFTAEQYGWATDGALADGYEWVEQADGTYKVLPVK